MGKTTFKGPVHARQGFRIGDYRHYPFGGDLRDAGALVAIYHVRHTCKPPACTDNKFATSQAVGGASSGTVSLTGNAASIPVPTALHFNLSAAPTGGQTLTFTITGTDYYGLHQTNTVTFAAGQTYQQSGRTFRSVTSVTWQWTGGTTATNLTIGDIQNAAQRGFVIGLPLPMEYAGTTGMMRPEVFADKAVVALAESRVCDFTASQSDRRGWVRLDYTAPQPNGTRVYDVIFPVSDVSNIGMGNNTYY